MSFAMYKIFVFLLAPSNLLFLAFVLAFALIVLRYARSGIIVLACAIVLMALFGIGPGANFLIQPLEERFPKWDASRGTPDGIVVLGGAISADLSAARGALAINEAVERLTAIAGLARRFPDIPIMLVGGNGSMIPGGPSEAHFARQLLEDFGIAPSRILLEERSRTTVENARFAKAMVNPLPGSRWLLVTSAHHMPRAVGTFRAAGFAVEAYPVDWRLGGADDLWQLFPSVGRGLARTDTAAHEWIGLLAYRLSGATPELLPRP